jgi:hypothetical protein
MSLLSKNLEQRLARRSSKSEGGPPALDNFTSSCTPDQASLKRGTRRSAFSRSTAF